MTDARYWSSATPRKPTFCPSPRRHSKRITADVYRSEGARERRRDRRHYRLSGETCGFKAWLRRMAEAA
jgi:hypothetical protein